MASLGSLVVSLAMDTAKFAGDIGKAGQQMARLKVEAAKVGQAIGINLAAGIGAMSALVASTVRNQIELANLATVAGTSEAELSRLAAGARTVGIQQDKLADILKDTQDKIGDFLQTGAGPMADFFENIAPQVGVTAEQFARLSGPDALKLYVSSLQKANLTQSEMVFYMEAIASDSTLLLPLLRDDAKGFDEMAKAADRFGAVAAPEVVEQSKELRKNIELLNLAKQGLGNRITEELLPTMNRLAAQMLNSADAAERMRDVATIAATGIRIFASAAVIAAGTLVNLGTLIGGIAAGMAMLGSGEFRAAARTMSDAVSDATRRRDEMWATVSSIWDKSGPASTATQRAQEDWPGRIVEPLRRAKDKAKKEAKEIISIRNSIVRVNVGGDREFVKAIAEIGEGAAELAKIEDLPFVQDMETLAQAIAQTPTAKLEQTRKEMMLFAEALKTGLINAEQFEEIVKTRLGTLNDTAVKPMFEEMSEFAKQAERNIQDALGDTLKKTLSGDFKSIGRMWGNLLLDMAAQAIAADIGKSLFPKGGGGFFSSLLSLFGFAKGGAFSGGQVVPFASGGVVSSPTMFPMRGGAMGLMGEAGPEAIMPLKRGSDGRLGVEGGGGTVVNNYNVQAGVSRNEMIAALQMMQQSIESRMIGVMRRQGAI